MRLNQNQHIVTPIDSLMGKLRRGKIRGTKINTQEWCDTIFRPQIQGGKAKRYQARLDDVAKYMSNVI